MNKKSGLHIKNKHKDKYDFVELQKSYPQLATFVKKNKYGDDSIDFANPQAVIALNSALLKFYYKINFWQIPPKYLCPPIPGRADYIHHIAEFLESEKEAISIFDVGVGANCIYPLIAYREYNWKVVGSDIDEVAIKNAQNIIEKNNLMENIEIRIQKDKNKIFENVIKQDEFFTICISNPPFHSSAEEANEGTERKNKNLGLKKGNQNFGGIASEVWCQGGELSFITQMIKESIKFKSNFKWFSTLVSKSTTMPLLYEVLKINGIQKIKTIDMAQGQKKSRILIWNFK